MVLRPACRSSVRSATLAPVTCHGGRQPAARAEERPSLRAPGRGLLATLVAAVVVAGCDAGSPTSDELARGAELYQAHCVTCHGGPTGGSTSDIPPRHNAEGHTWHHADCDLVDIVNDGLPPRDGYP
jgi:hypothetical protein